MTAVYAIVQTSGYGWGSARTLGTGAIAAVLLAAGSYPVHLLPTMLLLGGFGLAFPAMITLAMSGVRDSDTGVPAPRRLPGPDPRPRTRPNARSP